MEINRGLQGLETQTRFIGVRFLSNMHFRHLGRPPRFLSNLYKANLYELPFVIIGQGYLFIGEIMCFVYIPDRLSLAERIFFQFIPLTTPEDRDNRVSNFY